MSLVIDAPTIESKIRTEAEARGMTAEEYVETVLASHLQSTANSPARQPFYATATPDEWNKAFDSWIDDHPIRQPLPDSALRRESIYEET